MCNHCGICGNKQVRHLQVVPEDHIIGVDPSIAATRAQVRSLPAVL